MPEDINIVDQVVADSAEAAVAEDTQVTSVSAAVPAATGLLQQELLDLARLMVHPEVAATFLADNPVVSVDSPRLIPHPDYRSLATAAAVDTRIVVLEDTKEDMVTVDVIVRG